MTVANQESGIKIKIFSFFSYPAYANTMTFCTSALHFHRDNSTYMTVVFNTVERAGTTIV